MPEQLDDESLVAYLDGELSAADAAAVEQAAEHDEQVKQRLSKLQDSWAFLDELPEEELNPRVAQCTIEMVTLAIETESQGWVGWLKQYRFPVVLAAALLSLGAGMVYSQVRTYLSDRVALSNLHVAAASDILCAIPSEDFLEMLIENQNLKSMALRSQPQTSENPAAVYRELAIKTIDERLTWIEQLEPESQQWVVAKLNAYEKLKPAERNRATRYDEYIAVHQDESADYIAAGDAYFQLVHNSTSFAVAINDAVAAGDVQLQMDLLNEELAFNYILSESDRTNVRDWAEDIFWRDNDVLFSDLDPDALVLYAVSQYEPMSDELIEYMNDLEELLQGRARALFEAVPAASRRDVALAWLSSASEPEGRSQDPFVLREKFNNLDRKQREEMLLLPADVVRSQLTSPITP